jgi:glucose-1-phosphate thymidylyltransferase
MKAIVLAAGYATRLYPLTLKKAKPLLPVKGKAIIDYTIDGLSGISSLDEIYVVTNSKFYKDFCDWQESGKFQKNITIVNDNTTSDADKLGAIGDINLVIQQMEIDDDLIVVAGDNLFTFELKSFAEYFKKSGLSIACYKYPYKEELFNYGIVEIDKSNKVVSFQEKPKNPKSDLVSLCLYGLPKAKLGIIEAYLKSGHNKDAPGYYIEWLVSKEVVHCFTFENKWFDIGTHESYERANKEYNGIQK